jgi:16S rRNA (guanine527-N7)-methyltransferase
LPGIPLAIATGVPVTLIDSIGKKARFLASALRELGLAGEALVARAEELAHDAGYRERFRTATARAVASAPAVLELTVPFLAIGGRLLMQRGAFPDAERHAVADAAPMLGGRLAEERVLGGERRLVVVEKAGPCPGRFPRRAGVPAKRPLCFPANALASR